MYLDPAFGGMILQIVLALVVVGGTVIFSAKRKAKALFKKKEDQVYKNKVVVSEANDDGIVDLMADDK